MRVKIDKITQDPHYDFFHVEATAGKGTDKETVELTLQPHEFTMEALTEAMKEQVKYIKKRKDKKNLAKQFEGRVFEI